VRPGGGWSLLLDVAALGLDAVEASRLLLEESCIAATAMPGWGGPVAERHVRFVFSAEPVKRLATIPERLAGGKLAAAVRGHDGA
jgi:aspartate/methionine/tyrosine aminotransferase